MTEPGGELGFARQRLQGDPALLRDRFEDRIKARQKADIAEIERAHATGEFAAAVNATELIDMFFGSRIYRRLLGLPLTEQYGDALVDVALRAQGHESESAYNAGVFRTIGSRRSSSKKARCRLSDSGSGWSR